MKDAIIAKFKAKYPAVNLSKKRLDALADKLSPKVTDEAEIDTKLDEMNEILPFAEIAQQDDKIRDLQGKLRATPTKPENQSTDANDSTNQQQSNGADDMPAWFKAYAEKMDRLEAKERQQTIHEKIASHEKLKGIPKSFLEGRALPDKEEDLDSFADSIATKYSTFKQDLANEGLLNISRPVMGTTEGTDSAKVSPMMADYIASKQAEKK